MVKYANCSDALVGAVSKQCRGPHASAACNNLGYITRMFVLIETQIILNFKIFLKMEIP